jgi:tRNA nucleotidyltransferase (CCA-adding enzyme)
MHVFTKHPHWLAVNKICEVLFAEGFKAWLAGGCVRDGLLGILPKDFDVATDASTDEIEKLFSKTIAVGKSFGVMRVIVDGADIEVATFRKDGPYEDGRRPTSVEKATPEADAQRRDFTINALFYDLESKKVYDFINGQKDLKLRIIKTVGESELRFSEDYLRMLRGARFVSQLNFKLDDPTFLSIKKFSKLIEKVSGERIHDEMNKLFKGMRPDLGMKALEESDLLDAIFPKWPPIEASHLKKISQVSNPERAGWMIFLEGATPSQRHDVYSRLKFSNEKKDLLENALEDSKVILKFKDLTLAQKKQMASKKSMSLALDYLDLQGKLVKIVRDYIVNHQNIETPLINATDLKGLGLSEGKELGILLKEIYELQLNEKIRTKSEAIEWAKKNILID